MMTYYAAKEATLADLKRLKMDISLDHLDLRTGGGGTIYVEDVKSMLDVLFDRVHRIEQGVLAMDGRVGSVAEMTGKKSIEAVGDEIARLRDELEEKSNDLGYEESRVEELESRVDDLEHDLEEAEDKYPEIGFQFRTGGR
jgi:chromosome segregation ATPase